MASLFHNELNENKHFIHIKSKITLHAFLGYNSWSRNCKVVCTWHLSIFLISCCYPCGPIYNRVEVGGWVSDFQWPFSTSRQCGSCNPYKICNHKLYINSPHTDKMKSKGYYQLTKKGMTTNTKREDTHYIDLSLETEILHKFAKVFINT